ncbi:MAG: acyl-CoA dehydrogenase family protein [Gammaproteobacteria bacterium]|nr:acyl-CoA dehydrogenase family protein [Gammaproteobacteria bacterium]MBT8109093.1 acyl-CoA dehydrogenase family protein [Gammaproteobacteria bacterium]NND46545.1 acyl-CoA dehydrogenase [Woeseiaceae bacterium]NNL43796.1 acyl-CoA dehydrogenase [Woeseiaceae bacterium]
MDLGVSDRVQPLLDAVRTFINERVLPVDEEFLEEVSKGDRWSLTERQTEIMEDLKSAAREQGLWNFWLTDSDSGYGLSTVEYAWLAEETGRAHLAAEAFNCSAPDTGNMEVLERYGTEAQKEQWLKPLLEGEIRSAYAMTEPNVASSDATNISTSAVLEKGEWVINGEKTYASGAGDKRCKILICMVKTNPENNRHTQHSQILVPIDTPGVEVVRGMNVFATDDAPHGHMHIRLKNVRVPEDNIILGPGRGFEIAQGRLGPGRIHHCMRAIGMAERALQLLCERSVSRTAFGKPLAKLGGNYDVIANARINIDMARLLTLRAAHVIDTEGVQEAQVWISKIKAMIPIIAIDVIDDAIQMHGAAGLSQDFPLAAMYANARTLRLADGPDEVHRMVVARHELRPYIKRS